MKVHLNRKQKWTVFLFVMGALAVLTSLSAARIQSSGTHAHIGKVLTTLDYLG